MRLSVSLLHCISFYTLKCLVKCDIICCLSGLRFTMMCLYQPSILICIIKKESPHKENKRLPRFACTKVINITEPLKLLNTSCCFFFCFLFAYYEKSNFMHITLFLKRVEPISDDLLFPN